MEPQVRFCTSADGTRIAYAAYGDRTNDPLVLSAAFGYNQEAAWREPGNRAFYETLGRDRMLISYDRRGVGASQRDVQRLHDEAEVEDLAAVADALNLHHFDVASFHIVGAIYAALHPERVRRLVLWEPYVLPSEAGFLVNVERTVEVIRTNWAIARRALASYVFPEGPAEMQRWYSNVLRDGMSPEVAAGLLESEAAAGSDYREVFSRIAAPALVLHSKAGKLVALRSVQEAAACIPNSRLVALEGWVGSAETAEVVAAFLDEERGGRIAVKSTAAPPNVVAILFTDIADSTALTQRLGDAHAQELVRSHNDIVRKALQQHGGSEIKHTGDGIMASFQSASGALECAMAVQRAITEQADEHLAVHIGVNAGEPVAEENDLFGTSVQLARRICDAADAGEVLVSDVVRQLAAGKGFEFEERVDAILKGFDEPVRLYGVRWRG